MLRRKKITTLSLILLLLPAVAALLSGCNPTRRLQDQEYLLRKNHVQVSSGTGKPVKGTLKDEIRTLVIQEPNRHMLGFIPFRLWLYNRRYEKYQRDSADFSTGRWIAEPPVVYDSMARTRSSRNIRTHLFNRGYFYARVDDSVSFRRKKAFVHYHVTTGTQYLINKVNLDISDSFLAGYVKEAMSLSNLKKNREFTYSLLEAERSRITQLLRNKGFYRFAQNHISFEIDTLNKEYFRNIENPFENARNFISMQQQGATPTLDVTIIIRSDSASRFDFRQYQVGPVSVYPDFVSRDDIQDSTMKEIILDRVKFRYHDYYVSERVLLKHIYLIEGKLFTQDNYDLTITKLNELGLFQYVRLVLIEDTTDSSLPRVRCVVLLNPTRKYDITTNFEVSSGSTYSLGSAVSLGFRNRNLYKGGNQLSVTLSGGIETGYSPYQHDNFVRRFYLLSRNFGLNTNLVFPKFIVPFSTARMSRANLPKTILSSGVNLLDRVNYFTMVNITSGMTYNWRETPTKTWDISPAFINILRMPNMKDSFQRLIESNQFLRNSYKPNFIEGENIYFTFTDQGRPSARYGYSYVRVGLEEAGGLMSGINAIGRSFNNTFNFQYAQYVKFDFDARRYVILRRAMAAFRLHGGVGIPYGRSEALPYVKQYFVGGAYSIRGWRVRNLGPGGSIPNLRDINFIDRTGDIKLELNGEYRFPLVQLFTGALDLNGAVFTDAGNIWLFKEDPEYENGHFTWKRLGHDIAVSSGAGLRLDIGGIFTIRLDAAFPLKKPYVQGNSGWVLQDIDFGSQAWRNENLIMNIAIGYPF